MVASYVLIVTIRKLKRNLKIKTSALVRNVIGGVTVIAASLAAYLKIPSIRRQVSNILLRITDTDAINVSGMRHLLYYPYGLEIWLTCSNVFQMLFGYGMRCSGAAFSEQQDICRIIGIQQYSNAWAVECDVIGLLLGGGVCTFLAYYYEVVKCMRKKFEDAMIIIIFGGITYHYHSISYVIFLLMMLH